MAHIAYIAMMRDRLSTQCSCKGEHLYRLLLKGSWANPIREGAGALFGAASLADRSILSIAIYAILESVEILACQVTAS
jgi:hypothetical protein